MIDGTPEPCSMPRRLCRAFMSSFLHALPFCTNVTLVLLLYRRCFLIDRLCQGRAMLLMVINRLWSSVWMLLSPYNAESGPGQGMSYSIRSTEKDKGHTSLAQQDGSCWHICCLSANILLKNCVGLLPALLKSLQRQRHPSQL